jgi:hypothetical protein
MTATQWLFEKLWDTPKDKFEWYAILKEAEEKFQYQIEDAYETSHISMMTSKQYYHEKFGKIHADKRNITD